MTVIFLCVSVMAGSMKDPRDGKKYKTVKIGNQEWMAENLNFNADESFCYDNKPANCKKYGRLYTWQAALEACPEGWHLPTREEFKDIYELAGREGEKLKTKKGWAFDRGGYCIEYGCDYSAFGRKKIQHCSPINKKCSCGQGKSVCKHQYPYDYNGSDDYGFSALPAGHKESLRNEFSEISKTAIFWTSSESTIRAARALKISYTTINYYGDYLKKNGLSVRCIQGSNKVDVEQGTMTDSRDGRTYKTTKIGDQTWMAENLNYDSGKNQCYENDSPDCSTYGRLYNWKTAKGICPSGWHLPSKDELETLIKNAGTSPETRRANLSAKSWYGADIYGFSALPTFNGEVRSQVEYWSSTKDLILLIYGTHTESSVEISSHEDSEYGDDGAFFPVRCLQD